MLINAEFSKIEEGLYDFIEHPMGGEVHQYLLIGTEKALLIDTGCGFSDIPTAVRELTSLPLIVANTHAHQDHAHGNHLYDKVMLSSRDLEVFEQQNDYDYLMNLLIRDGAKYLDMPKEEVPDFCRKFGHDFCMAYPSVHYDLPKDRTIDLGDRLIKIIETPGHTPGHVSFLDVEKKRLFAGDLIFSWGICLHFPHCSLADECASLKKVKALVDQGTVTEIYTGHPEKVLPLEMLDITIEACEYLLDPKLAPGTIPESGIFVYRDKVTIQTYIGDKEYPGKKG